MPGPNRNLKNEGTQRKGGRRTGILGGTFDPLHSAHLFLAVSALEDAGLDRIVLMPSGCSYLKKDREISSAADRLAMARLAVEGDERFEVSDMEIRRGGETYTADTITEWHSAFPEDELYFITGADTLILMEKWVRPEEIFKGCTVLAALRDDADFEALKETAGRYRARFGANISFLTMPRMDLSASFLRQRVRLGRSIRYYVPEAVRSYIEEHGLYRKDGKGDRV